MKESLSIHEARRLVLSRQGLLSRRQFGSGIAGTQKAIEHLGYIQIDTLSVVARAHLHTLWNRTNAFKSEQLDVLQEQGKVFEHWSHALAILPMSEYRFSLPMMQRIASGDTHWHVKDEKETRKVLKRIREEGPLTAKDFKDKRTSDAMWARSPSKRALEQLFMEGELMIPRRINFHKVYDLRERVLPSDVDVRMPTVEEHCRHLILGFVRAQGIALPAEISYLRKGLGSQMLQTVRDMLENGELLQLAIAGQSYVSTAQTLSTLESKLPAGKLRILSPFDNVLIQRKRLAALFDFNYQIECYVPKAKRKYGYFCLPILRGHRFVGQLDAKVDRKAEVFHVINLYLSETLKVKDNFQQQLNAELARFAKFCGAARIEIHAIKNL